MNESLDQFDKWLFLLINGANHPVLDDIMALVSLKWIWIPLYAFMLFALIKHHRFQSIYIVLFVVLLVTMSDQLSVHLFKNMFLRLRPCHSADLQGLVHLVNNHCGGQYGFVSSHAANVFGLTFFIGPFLNISQRFWMPFLIFWAIVVSYSRIYLGVHYPFDVTVGALLGIAVARFLLAVLKLLNEKYNLKIHFS